jgi:hypothetical protein
MKTILLSLAIFGVLLLPLQSFAQDTEFYGDSSPASFSIVGDNVPISGMPVTIFVQRYVEEKINEWQQKGEFETTAAYQTRVNEQSRNTKAQELTNEALIEFKKEYSKSLDCKSLQLSRYDADNQTYMLQSDKLGNFAMPVAITDAPELKENWSNIMFENQDFYILDDKLVLAKLDIVIPSGKRFTYDSKQSTVYAANNISYNFKPLEIAVQQDVVQMGQTKIETTDIAVGQSDVAVNIPVNPQTNNKTFVLIIANENYRREVKVAYAINDGSTFKEYCEKTLGIPTSNIHFSKDATYGEMRSELNWINGVMKVFNGEAKVIFYYAGHGMPNDGDKTAYLLPVDGFSSDFESAIKLDYLYAKLAEYPAQNVTVFLDACFSGAQRGDGMLSETRGTRIVPKTSLLNGNMVVVSATSGDETAYPFKEKQHGLFTYFLLKKLQETKGNVTLKELTEYINTNVSQQSIVVNQKLQTPQVQFSDQIKDTWTGMLLK